MIPPPDEWAWLARIRRPQGRIGEVFADLLTDFPEKFSERKQLWLIAPQDAKPASGQPRALTDEDRRVSSLPLPRKVALANHWLHKGGIVLHFVGVDSISAAELLAGLVVAIPRAERVPLGEGETYIADLTGCTLVDVAGPVPVTVGTIDDVDRSAGQAPLLIVRGANSEILIPFAKSYLKKIDIKGRLVEMELPEGLVNLND